MIRPTPTATIYRDTPTDAQLRAGITRQCRADGCTCTPGPDFDLPTRRDRRQGRAAHVAVRHDEGCVLWQWIQAQEDHDQEHDGVTNRDTDEYRAHRAALDVTDPDPAVAAAQSAVTLARHRLDHVRRQHMRREAGAATVAHAEAQLGQALARLDHAHGDTGWRT